MDDRDCDFFCDADRDFKKQGKYRAPISCAGGGGRRFDLRHESVFFVAKSCFYYCAESAYDFDMRIFRNSGGYSAFLHPDFKHVIKISQKIFF